MPFVKKKVGLGWQIVISIVYLALFTWLLAVLNTHHNNMLIAAAFIGPQVYMSLVCIMSENDKNRTIRNFVYTVTTILYTAQLIALLFVTTKEVL